MKFRTIAKSKTARLLEISFLSVISLIAALLAGSPLRGASSAETASQPPKAQPVRARPAYAVLDLGVLPFVADDVGPSIDSAGDVCYWGLSKDGSIHAMVWRAGKARDLGVPKGYGSSIARCVSSTGEVVGWATPGPTPVDTHASVAACVWRRGGRIELLDPRKGRISRAFAVNSSGEIVGSDGPVEGPPRAFRYHKGKLIELPALPGGHSCSAYAIGETGVIAGASDSSSGTLMQACIWRSGAVDALGLLPGGHYSKALSVDRAGVVIGYAEAGGHGDAHAFIYSPLSRKMTDLGTLREYPTAAYGMNDHGEIVGLSSLTDSDKRACLWRSGKIVDLNARIASSPRWKLLRAFSIDNHGEITCLAANSKKENHLVVLNPISIGPPMGKR